MKMKTKLFAFLAVALMMALPLAAFIPSADADSDSNDSIDRIDDIADLQPIDFPEGFENGLEDGDAMLLGDSRATGVLEGMYPGSWTWDRTTGLGPYNSFYGAFDIDNGNAFVGVLDPYNLKKLVDGTDLSADGHFNIMWVLPTVYWSVDENGNLELSNDPSKGTAYAHTIDGHVYKYLAYGVYEATPNDDGTAPTTITSESGKTPLANNTLANFRNLASSDLSGTLGSGAWQMLWNYYQSQLYRFVSLSVMEDFNSQSIVGNGPIYQSLTVTTGATDLLGPYAGQTGNTNSDKASSCKLFLENTWGGKVDMVDVQRWGSFIYADSNHKPLSNPTNGTPDNVTKIEYVLDSTSYRYGVKIFTEDKLWGLAATTTDISDPDFGTTDGVWALGSAASLMSFGGNGSDSGYKAGINNILFSTIISTSSNYNGTRIAFVFDQDPMTFTPTSYDYVLNYDPTLMATTSKAISVAGMDPISHNAYTVTVESADSEFGTVEPTEIQNVSEGSEVHINGNTLTIGETVITATPAEGYRLASWSVSNGDMITSETTITATFELIPVPEPVENKLLKLIPLIVIIALTVMAAIALMSFTGNGIDLIKLLIGLTVCVLFVAMAMIPAVGGF